MKGYSIINGEPKVAELDFFYAINPQKNELLPGKFYKASCSDVELACESAMKSFQIYRKISIPKRVDFLRVIAEKISSLDDSFIERVSSETGLLKDRVIYEKQRCVNQFKLCAKYVEDNIPFDYRIDSNLMEGKGVDLRSRRIGLGPVLVFGASNFPLAFSSIGNDVASALAAGCSVVVKGHPSHPGVSELASQAILDAIEECSMPKGLYSLIVDDGNGYLLSKKLAENPNIKAIGFTGSKAGGTAIMRIASNRNEPIPVYAEMSSINPVFIYPERLKESMDGVLNSFVQSFYNASGQFCTSPGVVFMLDNDDYSKAKNQLIEAISELNSQTMLNEQIFINYEKITNEIEVKTNATLIAKGILNNSLKNQCQPMLFEVDFDDFYNTPMLQEEIFGSCAFIVKCKKDEYFSQILDVLDGQLTATIQMSDKDDMAKIQELIDTLELKVGRIVINGYPTGVEVSHAIVHGGPYPASSDSRTTSVGSMAINRFLRPVCYQAFPKNLLPTFLDVDKESEQVHLFNHPLGF